MARVQAEMLRKGIGPEELKRRATIKHDTWKRIREERNIWISTAKRIADKLTDGDLLKLYHPSILATLVADHGAAAVAPGLPDWEPLEPLSGCEPASNGLQYYLWKLKHRFEDNRLARGKHYDLTLLPTPEQHRLQNYLMRHGNICNRMAGHPRFPRHFTTTPDPQGQGWWVVDDWIEGRTLKTIFQQGKQKELNVPRLFQELLEAIRLLHEMEIIRRELSPRFILLRKSGDGVVLMDFELGKLLDGSPTVRTQFCRDPYRAPEAGGELHFEDRNVDLYSWGRILVHAVTGREPLPPGEDRRELEQVRLLPKVREIVLRCVSENATERPQSVEEVQEAIRAWK